MYRIYSCISQPFKTLKSVQKFALDLHMGQNLRSKRQSNNKNNICLSMSTNKYYVKNTPQRAVFSILFSVPGSVVKHSFERSIISSNFCK